MRSTRIFAALSVALASVAIVAPQVSASPFATTVAPTNGATGVSTTTDLVIVFNETMKAETGDIKVVRFADKVVVESIRVGESSKVLMGGATVTIKRSVVLAANTRYSIQIDPGAFKSVADNKSFGIESDGTWTFTTAAAGVTTTTTLPGATTTTTIASSTTVPTGNVASTRPGCRPVGFAGQVRSILAAADAGLPNLAFACSAHVAVRARSINVAVSTLGATANAEVASYTVRIDRIGGRFVAKQLRARPAAGILRTQFGPLLTGRWTVTITALSPAGATVGTWISPEFSIG